MARLAINGGKPIRPKSRKWPSWPVSDAADAKLLADITRSNTWSYDGPREWEFAEKKGADGGGGSASGGSTSPGERSASRKSNHTGTDRRDGMDEKPFDDNNEDVPF